jgi:hypothetical protein
MATSETPETRTSWLSDDGLPLIDEYARSLETFVDALADGRIDDGELAAQEARVVALMREVEPELSDSLHARVTRLLCELTAYDLMLMLHAFEQARPKASFEG